MKTNPSIQIGRFVLRRQADGSYKQDAIRLKLISHTNKETGKYDSECSVKVWWSDSKRLSESDSWVNYTLG